MAPVNQELVDLFIARAEAVAAQVQRLPNIAAALQYAVDVCARKAPCELLADEDVEKGPDGGLVVLDDTTILDRAKAILNV